MGIEWILFSCALIVLVVIILIMIIKTPGRNTGIQIALSVLAVFVLAVIFTGKSDRTQGIPAALIPEETVQDMQASFMLEEEQQEGQIGLVLLNRDESKEEGPYPAKEPVRADDVLAVDLNADGWEDLCIRGRSVDGLNVPYYCMLWKPQKHKFEYSVTLSNVEIDLGNQWIISQVRGTAGELFVTYCRYDGEDVLHMVRYVEENRAGDGFEHLDLTYVEEDDMYTLPAIVDEERFNVTMVEMAKQALSELYQWTGEKVETACFQVSNLGGVVFSLTPEDMAHSRVFFSRYFGADTEYNLSGYDKSISSIGVASGRSVWFSPVLWRVFPKNIEEMSDEEVVRWYFEQLPISETGGVKNIMQRYQDTDIWTIQAQSGQWFEVFYNEELREISDVTGPYSELPQH